MNARPETFASLLLMDILSRDEILELLEGWNA
jgi:hypothetical protein